MQTVGFHPRRCERHARVRSHGRANIQRRARDHSQGIGQPVRHLGAEHDRLGQRRGHQYATRGGVHGGVALAAPGTRRAAVAIVVDRGRLARAVGRAGRGRPGQRQHHPVGSVAGAGLAAVGGHRRGHAGGIGGARQPDSWAVAASHADGRQPKRYGSRRHRPDQQRHQHGAGGNAAEPAREAVWRWRRAGSVGGGGRRHRRPGGERERAEPVGNRAGRGQWAEPDQPGLERAAAGRGRPGARGGTAHAGHRRYRHPGHQRGHPRLPACEHQQHPAGGPLAGKHPEHAGRPAHHHRRGAIHRHADQPVPGAADRAPGHYCGDRGGGQHLPGALSRHDLQHRPERREFRVADQ
ncbi:hypothetical protein D3C72_1276370 [compost metagenome]